MADHNNNNPITGLLAMLLGSVTGIYGGIFLVGLAIGGITGNVPIRGSLLNPWETGQYVGGLFNAGGNSGIQTFGDEKYFQNSKQIGSDPKPNQRLMAPNQTPSTILPTSARTQNSNVSGQSSQESFTYTDTDGDGVISPDEIKAQNKKQ
jgi:hypothetical protein